MSPDASVTPAAAPAVDPKPQPTEGVKPPAGEDVDAFGKAVSKYPELANWADALKRKHAEATELKGRVSEYEQKVKDFESKDTSRVWKNRLLKRAASLGFAEEAVEKFLAENNGDLDLLDISLDDATRKSAPPKPPPKDDTPDDKFAKLERKIADMEKSSRRERELDNSETAAVAGINKLMPDSGGFDDEDRQDVYDVVMIAVDSALRSDRRPPDVGEMIEKRAKKLKSRYDRVSQREKDKYEKELAKRGRIVAADSEEPREPSKWQKHIGSPDVETDDIVKKAKALRDADRAAGR